MRAEFELQSQEFPYISPVGEDALPALPTSMRTP